MAFLTAVPVPGRRSGPGPTSLLWFGPVGAALGATLGAVWMGARSAFPAAVAAVIVVGLDAAATGLLHIDGLADTADGLLAPMDRQRRLEVMGDPAVGAFGTAAVVVTLLARAAALAAIRPSVVLLAGLWCLSRALMAAASVLLDYARPAGIASGMTAGAHRPAVTAASAASAAAGIAACVWWRPQGGAAAGAALLAAAGVLALARRRLGGYTGDVLGAACVVAETVGLMVASARW